MNMPITYQRYLPFRRFILPGLLCLIILLTMSPTPVFAAENNEDGSNSSYIPSPGLEPESQAFQMPQFTPTQPGSNRVRPGKDTIFLIHGFHGKQGSVSNGSGHGVDCNVVWKDVVDYIKREHAINGKSLTWGRTADIQMVGYYKEDTNCNANLHDKRYTERCNKYMTGHDGTNNESLYHLSCLFAWYIHLNYGHNPSWNVHIVAHSMGGLITRNMLYQVQKKKAPHAFPASLGVVAEVVTLATPHRGIDNSMGLPGFFACGGCQQFKDLAADSHFMKEMQSQAQNPQGSKGTEWTLAGSNCDGYVNMQNATYMAAAHHVVYLNNNNNGSCYDHGSILHDTSDTANAYYHYCQKCLTPPKGDGYPILNWNYWNKAPRSLHEIMHALWLY